jgi:hypothetical protein
MKVSNSKRRRSIPRHWVKFFCLMVLAPLLGSLSAQVQTQPPHVFFTDLISGPNRGGEKNRGTILTLYGARFGASRGSSTVKIGNGNAASYLAWTDAKISVAIGAAATTGNVTVRTANGTSNGVPFTVRLGKIYCVSTRGRDGNPGTFAGGCWASLPKARDAMQPGDITYLENGVADDASDGARDSVALTIYKSGKPGKPLAFVAYPGATVTLGDANKLEGIRILPGGRNTGQPTSYWVFAGLTLRGPFAAMTVDTSTGPSTDYRIVGNDFSCPKGDGQTGCYADNLISNVSFYGNNIHDVSTALPNGSSKQYHSVYFSTDANHIDFGWNQIHNDRSCRAIQFHSSPVSHSSGYQQYDLHVHDNVIHDNPCDGINFATVDPSKGPVEAYNNVIYNTGTGPNPPDGIANYGGIYLANIRNTGASCTAACGVNIYNNTFYNNGANHESLWGAIIANPGPVMPVVRNNIFYETSKTQYFDLKTSLVCEANLFFGAGGAPRGCINSVTGDPKFATNSGDFHLQSGSPAIDAGGNTGISSDRDGVSRPQGAGFDFGAYEFVYPTAKKPVAPPNLKASAK